jgi:hypothetical protein
LPSATSKALGRIVHVLCFMPSSSLRVVSRPDRWVPVQPAEHHAHRRVLGYVAPERLPEQRALRSHRRLDRRTDRTGGPVEGRRPQNQAVYGSQTGAESPEGHSWLEKPEVSECVLLAYLSTVSSVLPGSGPLIPTFFRAPASRERTRVIGASRSAGRK